MDRLLAAEARVAELEALLKECYDLGSVIPIRKGELGERIYAALWGDPEDAKKETDR
jgi:hypothetical protein